MAETETIWVKSNLPVAKDGGSGVALWEQSDAHPNGDAFVAGPVAVEVAQTAAVQTAIRDERVVKASAAEVSAAKKLRDATGAVVQANAVPANETAAQKKAREAAEKAQADAEAAAKAAQEAADKKAAEDAANQNPPA